MAANSVAPRSTAHYSVFSKCCTLTWLPTRTTVWYLPPPTPLLNKETGHRNAALSPLSQSWQTTNQHKFTALTLLCSNGPNARNSDCSPTGAGVTSSLKAGLESHLGATCWTAFHQPLFRQVCIYKTVHSSTADPDQPMFSPPPHSLTIGDRDSFVLLLLHSASIHLWLWDAASVDHLGKKIGAERGRGGSWMSLMHSSVQSLWFGLQFLVTAQLKRAHYHAVGPLRGNTLCLSIGIFFHNDGNYNHLQNLKTDSGQRTCLLLKHICTFSF